MTFVNFNVGCSGEYDAILATNPDNDDGMHPMTIETSRLFNVANESKVFLHRPNLHKISPKFCIDMDCDGMKKNLLSDLDGTFLGKPGAVISESEWEWGSQQRGLGDFRLPKDMLSAENGSMLNPSFVYKYRGIVREEDRCEYQPMWQAHKCHGLDYKMLIIESMDNDTESRRLSPVAILSDNKYVDLINGPPSKLNLNITW